MITMIRLKIGIVSIMLIAVNYGCVKDFDDQNTPNNLVIEEVVNVDLIFTRVQVYSTLRNYGGSVGRSAKYAGQAISESGGAFNVDVVTDLWDATYTNYIRNLSEIMRLTKDDPELVNKYAMARILKVLAFAQCTDFHGDIPYFEVAQPMDQIIYEPKYDTQKSIYEDLFKELKEAAADLDASKDTYGSADIFYEGDVEKWEKFANSLRLRLAMRIRYVDSQLAESQISDLTDDNLIVSSDDNAFVFTSNDYPENRNNDYATLLSNGTDLYKKLMPKTVLDIWKNNYDPRLKLYADTAMATFQSFGYRGRPLLGDCPQEQKNPYGFESVSRQSMHMYAAIWPVPVMTAAEVNFALAEAALFGLKGTMADAQTYYSNGYEAALNWSLLWYQTTTGQIAELFSYFDPAMDGAAITAYDEFHAITEAEISAFLDSASVLTLTGTPEEKFEMVINQKAVSFYPTMIHDAYSEWRRTGYPRVLIGDDAGELAGVSPRRGLYPYTEQTLNGDNLDEAIQRMGGTDHALNPVWWDANPSVPYEHPEEVEWRDLPWIETK